jgi:uncharacterized protein YsxB (DUF464 family)
MIRVTIDRAEDGRIRAFTLLGHADYSEPGQDIVCAGVSAVSFGTVNAIESLLKLELVCDTDEKDGLFKAVIPSLSDPATDEKLQLLLDSMVVMLQSIEESYGEYMIVTQ